MWKPLKPLSPSLEPMAAGDLTKGCIFVDPCGLLVVVGGSLKAIFFSVGGFGVG